MATCRSVFSTWKVRCGARSGGIGGWQSSGLRHHFAKMLFAAAARHPFKIGIPESKAGDCDWSSYALGLPIVLPIVAEKAMATVIGEIDVWQLANVAADSYARASFSS